ADLILDTVGLAKVVNRLATAWYRTVVIDDDVTPRGQLGIQIDQSIHRGLIKVPIQTNDRELLDRSGRQRIAKPPFQKTDLFVQQTISLEVALHLIERNGQCFKGVKHVAGIVRILLGVGCWKSFKRVGDSNRPV